MLKPLVKKFAIWATIITIITNIYIFTYPSIHPTQCSWKCYDKTNESSEPDISSLSSLGKYTYYTKRYLNDIKNQYLTKTEQENTNDIHLLAFGDPQIKGIWHNTPYITRLDTFGNDYYLGHIYSMMQKRLSPTHVAIMGDLFSSQWIGDSEFFNRTKRYMNRIFKRNADDTWLYDLKKNNHDEMGLYKVNWTKYANEFKLNPNNSFAGYKDVYSWDPENENYLFINITGNHDVGYSGDATYQHMSRYHEIFGKDNFFIEYDVETDHPWRIVVLNTLTLEGPALQPEFVDNTWEFLYQVFERRFNGSTILLTHVPFYKEEGLCVDGPEFRYYPEVYEKEPYKANLLRSQNHMSEEATNKVFNLIFDNKKPGIVLNGHDHEGCETIYNKKGASWIATKDIDPSADYYLQEITVRAMMGEFNGNTGLVTGHFNELTKLWDFNFTLCPFNIQHFWWAAKASAIITGFIWSFYVLL
ncbi:Ted1p NDAI_0A02680 [Naumovozyma dairenensis CBS 421]|uniref:Calcineurin-like phosphoesterase domain-containing protein n=1 Tax=Naumovozyma dairenensis (strain ATCC 10597 / BCRC 20456 / CBS 421 / NBRC 0211 / NRRL Y-12639) TaxID=1071378 RepID=G0W3N8_NAUDC|nr:hypothetical protein NDAI_0A02680 [Naumovozyma dairenensis CBS 421]CCD22426.1 hypothetical protein NDAI_0A02680 [Naumovozyma dairenensis CBS 421]